MKPAHLSIYIRTRRKELGLTQREVGAALGYTSQFVTNWERGMSSPPARALPKLCRVLATRPAHMLDLLARDSAEFYRGIFKLHNRGGLFSAPGR